MIKDPRSPEERAAQLKNSYARRRDVDTAQPGEAEFEVKTWSKIIDGIRADQKAAGDPGT